MVKEIVPGVLWLRMPLPLSLSHINLWAVRDGMTPDTACSRKQYVSHINAECTDAIAGKPSPTGFAWIL
ncbi:hypothetical protein WH284_04985 [Pseudomonas sp. MYb371]